MVISDTKRILVAGGAGFWVHICVPVSSMRDMK